MYNHKTPKHPRPALIRSLEPRFLFDGAAVGTAADTATDQDYGSDHGAAEHAQQGSMTAEAVAAQSQSPATKALQASQAARQQDETADDQQASASDASNTSDTDTNPDSSGKASDSRGVIFVDSNVTNYESLVEELDSDAEVVILDGESDGIEQIASYLKDQQGISSVHILSHGEEGELSLGTATLDQASMAGEYSDELATIGNALTEDGDILLYACDFSSGQLGLEAATQLANLTGADVASSSDDTGSLRYNGDWDLENQTGEIEASVLSATAWDGRLADTVELDFSATPTLVSGPGTGLQEGAVYLYSDVADNLDVRVTIDEISAGVTIDSLDINTGIAEAFFSQLTSTSADGYVQYTFDFIEADTGDASNISFVANAIDLDNVTESTVLYGASNYTTESNTFVDIVVDSDNSSIVATGGGTTVGLDRADTLYIVSAVYENTSSFTYRAGVSNNVRQVGLLFEDFDTAELGDINYIDGETTQLPVARGDFTTTLANNDVVFDPRTNDAQGSAPLTVSEVNGVSISVGDNVDVTGGSVALNVDGELVFTPDADYTGTVDFSYKVTDANGNSSSSEVTVAVITPYVDQVSSDGDVISISAVTTFSDLDNYDDLTYSATGLTDSLSINPATGIITGTLSADDSQGGPYTITVTGVDNDGNQISDTFELTVNNIVPEASNDTAALAENAAGSGNVLTNDNDGGADTDTLTVSQVDADADNVGAAVAGDNGGLITIASDGSYTFVQGTDFDDLADGESRVTAVDYQVSDGQGGLDTATLSITVTGVNDAPVVATPTDDIVAVDGETLTIAAGDAFSDVDVTDVLSYTAAGLPAGLAINATTGEITGTLSVDASQNGPFAITVTATDGKGGTIDDTFTLTVSNVVPVAVDDAATAVENVTPTTGNVLTNDSDGGADTDTLIVSQVDADADNVGEAVAGDNGGLITIASDGSYTFAQGTDFDDLADGESRVTAIDYQISDG